MNARMAWALAAGLMIGGAGLAAMPGTAVADDATCGSKENPCPLQKWMRQNMGAAMASGDMAALAVAFDKSAALSPEPKWNGPDPKVNWDAMAKAGTDAAKAKDITAVKGACKSCHDSYKDKYKTSFRTRAVP